MKLKAVIKEKNSSRSGFPAGTIVKIVENMDADCADVFNAPIGRAYLCEDDEGNLTYVPATDLRFIRMENYNKHILELRVELVKRAMEATIRGLTGPCNLMDILSEGYQGGKKTYPNEIAQFAVACADAIIEELTTKKTPNHLQETEDVVNKSSE